MILELKDAGLLRQAALIDGNWVPVAGRASVAVDDPSSGAQIGEVPDCSAAETEAAIAAASAAWPQWRGMTAHERAILLERWHALVLDNREDLARILTAEQGKPFAEAQGEIRYAATFIKWFAEEGRRVGGHNVASPERDRRIILISEPIGVSAAITPWNFPAQTVLRKCAAALAAGCTVVLKPSDLTPFTALALGELAMRAGFPAGVLNIVTGMPHEIGATITASPVVRKLSFTGSTRVGSLLYRQCADTVKKLSLELGGNAPLIVFEDADLDLAVAATMVSKFRNGGQTCVCANRIMVHAAVYDEFAARLGRAVSELRVAPGMEPGATIGPMINMPTVEKIRTHVDDALAKGSTILATGSGRQDGQFVLPLVIGGATPDMICASEETFGPVAPLYRFGSEAEALEMANATPFGLASYFYTRDLSRAFRVAERLEAGMVGLNTGSLALEMVPFGGVKQSGLGREGGQAGIEEYLETKAFHIGGLDL
ncbi:MAG: NAD-dependent succinate-semialdehyde dehydrogenase [Novosphingobium sp.]